MMNAEDSKPDDDLFDPSPKQQEEDDGDIWRSAVTEPVSQRRDSSTNEEFQNAPAENIENNHEPLSSSPPAATAEPESKPTEPAAPEETPPVAPPVAEPTPVAAPPPIVNTEIPTPTRTSAAPAPITSSGTTVGDGELNITVVDPQKRGDGMGAYVVYKVATTTTLPFFGGRQFEVFRRYSDFLGLYTKLRDKYAAYGRIVPPPPEKDMIGTTMTKVSKDQTANSADFVNRRRCALERFMQRLVCSTLYRQDPDLRDFVTQTGDLPKASDTSALSTAGIKRLFNKVSNTMTSVVTPFEDPDPWFEERLEQVSILENQLKKLVDAAEGLQSCRHDSAQGIGALGAALRLLANAEENNGLARAISQLAEVTERVQEVRQSQSEADSLLFAEQVRDYVTWLVGVRGVFEERCKGYRKSKELEQQLNRKREAKARAELQNPAVPDKVRALDEECEQVNTQLERSKAECEKMSATLKEELGQFEMGRARDFMRFSRAYLERQADTQQQLIDLYEGLLPELKEMKNSAA